MSNVIATRSDLDTAIQDYCATTPTFPNGPISLWDVSAIADFSGVFWYNCPPGAGAGGNPDLSSWDVSSATNMIGMLENVDLFNGDISGWNTAKVTNMQDMFNGAALFNGDISGWNTAKVTSMAYMFQSAELFNQDISSWDILSVTSMEYMFNKGPAASMAFNQALCWDIPSTSGPGSVNVENMFTGTSGSADPTQAKCTVVVTPQPTLKPTLRPYPAPTPLPTLLPTPQPTQAPMDWGTFGEGAASGAALVIFGVGVLALVMYRETTKGMMGFGAKSTLEPAPQASKNKAPPRAASSLDVVEPTGSSLDA